MCDRGYHRCGHCHSVTSIDGNVLIDWFVLSGQRICVGVGNPKKKSVDSHISFYLQDALRHCINTQVIYTLICYNKSRGKNLLAEKGKI